MTQLTRQDMQQALNQTRDQISSNMLHKSDLQHIMGQIRDSVARDLGSLRAENQIALQNNQAKYDALNQRMTTIERNLQIIMNEMAKLSDSISKQNEALGSTEVNPFMYQRL